MRGKSGGFFCVFFFFTVDVVDWTMYRTVVTLLRKKRKSIDKKILQGNAKVLKGNAKFAH